MQYRREVDGLRAVAVIPVILFHAGLAAFAGGYVGVDVFFVISGYLITSIILEDLEDGTFSLARFYERRVRRIFPAFAVMMLFCAALAAILLLPSLAKLVSNSVAAASVFASNMLYLRRTGYFGTPQEMRPLLHTWTLGVEEQYYLVFPLFMIIAWKGGRSRLLASLVALIALSFVFAEWAAAHRPAWGFYLLPSRGWELGIGALLAFYLSQKPFASWSFGWLQALSLLGLGMIAYAVVRFDANTPTPSHYTLIPTLGAALIILCASPATLAGRLLGSRVAVAIGLASYSLYLWHQPIFVFVRDVSLLPPDNRIQAIEYVVLAVVTWVSWRFVEKPFRNGSRFSRRGVFCLALGTSAVLLAVGLAGHFTNGTFGLPRNVAAARNLQVRFVKNHGLGEACVDGLSPARCRTSPQPEILVWGDSYAMHLVPGLLASHPGAAIEQATEYTCGPVLGVAPVGEDYTRDWAKDCILNNDRILEHIRRTPSIRYVLMGTIYSSYLSVDWNWKLMLRDGSLVDPDSASLSHFLETIRALRALGVEPVLISPPPHSGYDLGMCTERAAFYHLSDARCQFQLRDAEKLQAKEFALLRRLESAVRVIWLTPEICSDGTCRPRIGNTFLYADNGHLTNEGSVYLGRKLDFYGFITRRWVPPRGLPQS